MSSKRGIALLIVVALLAGMSIAAGLAALSARLSAASAFASISRAQMRAHSETLALRSGLLLLREDDAWIADGRAYEAELDGIKFTIRIQAETGRFDLNHGNPETLAAILEDFDITARNSLRIAGALADWRDEDDEMGDNGAEARSYRAAGLLPPGNRNFLAVPEFRNVMGVDADIYDQVAPYLTIHGGEEIASRMAPPALLEAAGLNRTQIRRVIAARRNNGEIPDIEDATAFDPSQGARYAVYVEAVSPAGAEMAREYILAIPGDNATLDVLSRRSIAMGYANFLDPELED